MARYFGIILCVIAVSHYAVSSEDVPKKTLCSERSPEFATAGNRTRDKFKVLVNEAITNPETLTTNLVDFKNELIAFITVGNKSCGQNVTLPDFNLFVDLIEFSLKNVTVLTELVKKKGFECIRSHQNNITHCVRLELKSEENSTKRTVYGELAVKGYLQYSDIDLKCGQSAAIKNCTVKHLKDCDSLVKDYVGSLFDFVSSKICKNLTTNHNNKSGTGGLKKSAFYGLLACGLLVLNL